MKKARYQFVKGRGKPHKISYWRADGKRAAKFFAAQGDALIFQAKLNEDLKDDLPDNLALSVDDRIIVAQIRSECARLNATLSDALACVKEYMPVFWGTKNDVGADWNVALQSYLADCVQRGARQSTVAGYSFLILKFQKKTGVHNICEATESIVDNFLKTIKSPAHYLRALRPFFNFCVEKKWISKNVFANAKLPRILREKAAPSIITPDECQRLLNAVPDTWKPTFALMAFAGLRPGEVISPAREPVLKIADIDFLKKRIVVPATVSKTRMARVLTGLPDNIWPWLEHLKNRAKDNNVAPESYGVFRRIKDNSGITLDKDVLRHSFASYGYHFLGAEHAVEILGHIGGFGVFAKHYKGLTTKADAKAYFSIFPDK